MKEKHFFTSESVSEGHPDKIADQISDSILDAILTQDKDARVACETTVSTGLVLVVGEISTSAYVDIQSIIRQTIKDIGYDNASIGFDGNTCAVLIALDEQSSDIAMGVDDAIEYREKGIDPLDKIGAGDQGLMFGYATNETPEFMPLSLSLSHKLMRKIAQVRKDNELDYLRPDAKAQVTVEYDENEIPFRVDTVVLSTQHNEEVQLAQLKKDIEDKVIRNVISDDLIDEDTKFIINPTGRFVIGGPQGDSGLTGRKIIVDTYGGLAHHGGGAFSGKDATKVDRSASYAARYIAKNMVAAKIAEKFEIQIAYAIGVAQPVSIHVDTFGTSEISEEKIIACIRELFDLRPAGIIEMLDLQRPIYKQTSVYGHFGRTDVDLPWEHLDKVEDIKKYLN
ncbi:S-adenosylmethionine synthase [Companilactobacillus sp. RD055328]|uniref:methionine adenosyltransferase n=1 Tax=Companilactobacillus sp. RD055328 TaxID=2916634 RepID=UPI001FC81906|nr:methionine adenosyltransferase [Companilactobacillus sp. RD055328]GKQ42471.1 S-adenosylmethionine synthase [Companilactobacillus sp. RD055328]